MYRKFCYSAPVPQPRDLYCPYTKTFLDGIPVTVVGLCKIMKTLRSTILSQTASSEGDTLAPSKPVVPRSKTGRDYPLSEPPTCILPQRKSQSLGQFPFLIFSLHQIWNFHKPRVTPLNLRDLPASSGRPGAPYFIPCFIKLVCFWAVCASIA